MTDPAYSDAHIEREIDRRIMKRLATDPQYRYAEDAEAQAEIEHVIELEEELAVLNNRPAAFASRREEIRDELDRIKRLGF